MDRERMNYLQGYQAYYRTFFAEILKNIKLVRISTRIEKPRQCSIKYEIFTYVPYKAI